MRRFLFEEEERTKHNDEGNSGLDVVENLDFIAVFLLAVGRDVVDVDDPRRKHKADCLEGDQ